MREAQASVCTCVVRSSSCMGGASNVPDPTIRGACITVELPAAVARLDSGRLANADSTLLASREGGR